MAFDVLKETHKAYQDAGTGAAAKTFILKAFKNLASWEAAMVGFTFGKALLPSIGFLPLGGILAGAAVSVGVSKLLNRVLPTNSHQTEGQTGDSEALALSWQS